MKTLGARKILILVATNVKVLNSVLLAKSVISHLQRKYCVHLTSLCTRATDKNLTFKRKCLDFKPAELSVHSYWKSKYLSRVWRRLPMFGWGHSGCVFPWNWVSQTALEADINQWLCIVTNRMNDYSDSAKTLFRHTAPVWWVTLLQKAWAADQLETLWRRFNFMSAGHLNSDHNT